MAAVSKLACVSRLKNQVALITGASTGIGRGIALAMADEEADVIINFIGDEKAAHELADQIRRKDVRAIAIEADVSDENQVQHMFDKATRELGTVIILVNNAGIQKDAVFHEMTLTDWRKVMDVNLTGAFLWARWQQHDAENEKRIDHGPWAAFLKKYLITGHSSGVNLVSYDAVTPEDKARLDNYLDRLQRIPVSNLNRAEQKAFWINAYNALTVQVILDHYPVDSIRDIDLSGWFTSGPWKAELLSIEGIALTLDDIEHRILRPIWEDNRIHYAVNCASIGCPDLQNVPFTVQNDVKNGI